MWEGFQPPTLFVTKPRGCSPATATAALTWIKALSARRPQTGPMNKTTSLPASTVSLRRLGAAPHRLMFFIGASNLLLAMAWWAAWLAAARWPAIAMPQPQPLAGWLHAFVMQYQMLPSFIFGFLLTTFPRWTGLPEFGRRRYLPVGLGIFGGQIATLLGVLGWDAGIVVGLLMTVAGWTLGLATLATLLWRERGTTWHARSCFAALVLGYVGLLGFVVFVFGGSPLWMFASIKVGTFGLLLPVYMTVAHRMFPFFAASVLPGYTPWRPLWLLALFWALCLGHLLLELVHAYGWLWLVDLPLLALTATMLWRWWPKDMDVRVPWAGASGILPPAAQGSASAASAGCARAAAPLVDPCTSHDAQERPNDIKVRVPGLLTVLFVGLAWLPVAFALYSAQSVAYAMTGVYWLGRGPAHALFVGFFGSVLIAMVTRVTQGHSGRPLVMPAAAWFAFGMIQLVAVLRVSAEVLPDGMAWQAVAAVGWLLAFAPWVLRIGRITLTPRADGKPG